MRKKLNFDYGKFDYVIHDGRAILLDINKTVGVEIIYGVPDLEGQRRYRADGIYSYFK
jgi:hypothetical protein